MTAVQTITQEVSAIAQGNTIYSDYQARWRYLLASYLGGEEYRQGQYLTRYQLESDAEYIQRLRSTPLENHCASVISVYTSFLFREEPERELGSLENYPEIRDFLEDADLDGQNFNSFMKEVSIWSNVFGHCWVIVAKPNVGAATRADEITVGARPYVSVLSPLVVLDWNWTRTATGRYVLTYLKYVEDINGDVQTIKEWRQDSIKTTVYDAGKKFVISEVEETNGLGLIPAVISYAKKSTVRGIGISQISDIADAQRFIYNATSEVEQSIRLDSHPSLVKTNETEAGIGAGSLINMPDNLDPGLKPYALEFSGASVSSIYESIKHTVEAIDKMANTGAVRATESRTMSGVAMQTEFQLLNAKLSEMADNIELCEEQIWQLIAMYMGTEWSGEIDYPGSFSIQDLGTEYKNLIDAKAAATDPRVLAVIDNRLVDLLDENPAVILGEEPGETIGTEIAEYTDPVTGEFETEQLINPVTGEIREVSTASEYRQLRSAGWIEE